MVDGKVQYTPVDLFGGEGTETFTFIVSDIHGVQSTAATVTVNVVPNQMPVAEDDTGFSTDADAVLSDGGLLSNDTDPDGDTLSTVAETLVSSKGAAVTIDADGNFTYDPSVSAELLALAQGETVYDTFTYTISDGRGGTATATVTIQVTGLNDAPEAGDDSFGTDALTSVGGDLLGNDTDPDTAATLSAVAGSLTSTKGGGCHDQCRRNVHV